MPHSQGRWTSALGAGDGQIFLGPSHFVDIAGHATFSSTGQGDFAYALAASLTANFWCNVSPILRSAALALATPAGSQRQFGTAAAVPGPSAVSGTSDPLALPPGFPPWTGATLPTLTGGVSGPLPKGIAPISLQFVYTVTAVALTSLTCSLVNTNYVGGQAPTVTSLLALGNNNLPLTVGAQPHKSFANYFPTSPVYLNTDSSNLMINFNPTTPAGGTFRFIGAILGVTFNYN